MSRKAVARNRANQINELVDFLRSRHDWVSLPEILSLGIAQYNARIYEARHQLGLRIKNRTEVIDGVRHSWFRLETEPALVPTVTAANECHSVPPETFPLFTEGEGQRARSTSQAQQVPLVGLEFSEAV
jgi:hypothetical protein